VADRLWLTKRIREEEEVEVVNSMSVCAVCADVKSRCRAVKEWLMPLSSGELSVARYDSVLVQPLSWEIPSLQCLWLGESADDRHVRMMVLLRCFGCYDDGDTVLLNQTYVPPRFLILCLVLR